MTFKEFYPYYLAQHTNWPCLACHIAGFEIALISAVLLLSSGLFPLLLVPAFIAYSFAWFGHLYYAKNHPATFAFDKTPWAPVFSFICYWRMMYSLFSGGISGTSID